MDRILILAVTASLLSGPMMAAPSSAPPAPLSASSSTEYALHPKTEAGLKCMLDMGPWGCGTRLFDYDPLKMGCRSEDWIRSTGVCRNIDSILHLGTNAAGDDVYRVNFINRTGTHKGTNFYVLSQPGPDGK